MTASDTSSLVLRKTSLTMRERFTPARSCSTLTRICANFRLVRFSASVSSPRGGFFFRLAGLLHRRLIALESAILVQGGHRWIADPFRFGYLFVVRLAGIRSAEVVNPFPPGVDEDHVLVAMLLLAPAVKKGLFFRVFRPLAPPLGGVNDPPRRFPGSALGLGKVRGDALGENPQVIQGRAQDRQQPMDPIIHLGLAETKEFAHDRLERIGLEVEQKKQELILGLLQSPLATTTDRTLAGLALGGLGCGVELLICLGKGRQQTLELQERQARESQKMPAVGPECFVGDHAFILFLIPDKVYCKPPRCSVPVRVVSSLGRFVAEQPAERSFSFTSAFTPSSAAAASCRQSVGFAFVQALTSTSIWNNDL